MDNYLRWTNSNCEVLGPMSQTQLIGGQENLQIPVIVRQLNEVADDGLFVTLKYTAELPILARMELLQ